MKCSYCQKPAIYHRKYSGERLCEKHFSVKIEKKVWSNVRGYIKPDVRIGLAVSGGKDSLTMAYVVSKLLKKHRSTLKVNLIGLIVDEGIPNYRDVSIKAAVELLEELNVPFEIGSFKEEFGFRLSDIISDRNKRLSCTYCGVFRRRTLDILARRNKVEYIFTGHNASDIAQTVLLNVIQGNIKNLIMSVKPVAAVPPRVYPLRDIIECETTLYAYINNIHYCDVPCPYTTYSLRNSIRNFLVKLEKERPGITYSIITLSERIKQLGHDLPYRMSACKVCGFPSSKEKCKVCEILEKLRQTGFMG